MIETQNRAKVKTGEVVFREDLYPRIKSDPALIQRYAENLEVLPPIQINQNNILIDGFHRWTAHRKMNAEFIEVDIVQTTSEAEVFALAIQANSTHGLQMNEADKKNAAIRLYGAGTLLDKTAIAKTLSVSCRTINNYLTDVDRQLQEKRKEQIFNLWLSCHTQEDIAETVGISQMEVSRETGLLNNLEILPKSLKLSANFQDDDFTPPLYSLWSFGKKTNKVNHFGNSEQRILENLLYLYTQPFDIVIDPFAGGAATIDVCTKRLRRYWISDRKPVVERETEIRLMDICQDLPPLNKRWSEVTLTYLDPPYWKQAENKYSDSPADLANMSLDEFTSKTAGVVNRIADKQSRGAIAMLMQPTQWKNDNHEVTDHIIDIINGVTNKKLKLAYRIACPYSSEQCTPQQVIWAKENKSLLVITRELLIWKVLSD